MKERDLLMKKLKLMAAGGMPLLLSAVLSAPALAEIPANSQKSCADFVQKFYNWYAPPHSQNEPFNGEKSTDDALKLKRQFFSNDLYRELKIDSDAASKSPGEIVGLDFDPFLNAQDVAARYVTGKVIPRKNSYRVEVYGYWNGKKNVEPDVVPELEYRNARWVFVNFYYLRKGQNDNLRNVLKALRKERESAPANK